MSRATPKLELLYFPGCPNLDPARAQLRKACLAVGLPGAWAEIDVSDPAAPARAQGYGSPTILVNGRDVLAEGPSTGATCRLYPGSDVPGVPGLAALQQALRAALSQPE